MFLFWRSPSHGAKPLGLPSSHQSSHQCAQAHPAHPPPPKLAQWPRLTNQAALRCQGEGRGRGWCCWAHPGTSFVKVETQGMARATQPASSSETWQAGQENLFVGAYKFWWPGVQWAVLWIVVTQCLVAGGSCPALSPVHAPRTSYESIEVDRRGFWVCLLGPGPRRGADGKFAAPCKHTTGCTDFNNSSCKGLKILC